MLWLQQYITGYDDLWSQIEFRLVMTFDVVAVPFWRFENTIQPVPEVWRIRKGRCVVQIGHKKCLAQEGDTVLLTAGEYRLTTNPDDAPLEVIGFGCSAWMFGAVDLVSLLQPPLCFRAAPQSHKHLSELLENIVRESRAAELGYSMAASGYAQLALVEALRACIAPKHDDNQLSLEARVLHRLQAAQRNEVGARLRLIEEQFQQPLDVARMAQAAHLSPQHFSRKFKAALGVAPMEYLRSFRLRRARCNFCRATTASRTSRKAAALKTPPIFRESSNTSSVPRPWSFDSTCAVCPNSAHRFLSRARGASV
jgi:AraC-like DNA-binding protein